MRADMKHYFEKVSETRDSGICFGTSVSWDTISRHCCMTTVTKHDFEKKNIDNRDSVVLHSEA